ncbi:MAG: UDP-4-amino-4,6-dideoxy-N-acetyl-beta-L-altrosamine transaminase [Bacteriovoracaceae bacterium]|jgi:UDP-4-amino-4,6-dideoxy-N-acetyl-beta-L-altrosamine transaminase
MSFIPYGRQDINAEDIKSVVDVLNSDFLTQGPKVPLFEKSISDYTNVKYSFAFNSATSALHVACLALGVGEGDIVWTSPISFVASANCALYCGATVDFVEIDSKTYNLCPQELEQKLIQAKKNNSLPKVVIPVHLSGQSCDMEKIHKLSKEYGFKIIEDASHAIGAKYQGLPIGNCKYSDICIFSFHPVKIITSAEGGMATTNSSELATKLDLLRSHGVTRDMNLMENESHGPWYYEQVDLGFNYRMTELQGALGASQMNRLDEFIISRNEVVKMYNKQLSNLPVTLPYQESFNDSSWHLYIIRLNSGKTKFNHLETFNKLREANIGVNLHYMPIYLQPYYQKLGFKPGYLPKAEKYYSEAISIPVYSTITKEQVQRVCDVLKDIL